MRRRVRTEQRVLKMKLNARHWMQDSAEKDVMNDVRLNSRGLQWSKILKTVFESECG